MRKLKIPKIEARRPFLWNEKGYLESDRDYVLNNLDAAIMLLDNEFAKQQKRR